MFTIIACIAPTVAFALLLTFDRDAARAPRVVLREARHRPISVSLRGRWGGLAEQIAQLEDRSPRHSDAVTQRRHLAAVLPADARR